MTGNSNTKLRTRARLLATLAVALGAACTNTAAAPTPPPVQAFFSYAQISDVQISPDGKYLAMVVADSKTGTGRKNLVVLDLDNHRVTASFKTIVGQDIYRYWWANDERLLIATAVQSWNLDSPLQDGRLYGINVDGSQLRSLLDKVPGSPDSDTYIFHPPLSPFFSKVLYIPRQDAREVVIQTVEPPIRNSPAAAPLFNQLSEFSLGNLPSSAYSLDIYDGSLRSIARSSAVGGELLADQEGAVRLATGHNVRTGDAEFLYRKSGADSDWIDISAHHDSHVEIALLEPLGFALDNHEIYCLGPMPTGTRGLFELDPETFKTKLVFGDLDSDVDHVIWSFAWQKTRHIIAVVTVAGFPVLHVLDSDSAKARDLASLYAAFPDQVARITSNTRDKVKMVVFVSSDRDPGSYYLFNARNDQVSLLFNSMAGIDSSRMASMRPVSFKAHDGVTLYGYLTLPHDSGGRNLPLIINPNANPAGRDAWGWDPEAQFFAAHGYAWLQVNYRGSGGYGMKFQDLGYRHWGTTVQSDLADAVQWAVRQGIADPKRVCIYGAGFGGYVALENSILYPKLYQCAVGFAGVYDLTTLSRSDFGRSAAGKHYLDAAIGNDPAKLKVESPVYQADEIQDPLFIAYGGADTFALPENSIELIAALDKAGKHYELMYEPNEGHGFAEPEHRFELYTRMLAFFDKYIGPDAAIH